MPIEIKREGNEKFKVPYLDPERKLPERISDVIGRMIETLMPEDRERYEQERNKLESENKDSQLKETE